MQSVQKLSNDKGWHGTKLGVTIQGAWASHRAFILRYLRQIAVITPYAQISFKYVSIDGRNDVSMTFKRRTTVMPEPPRQVLKNHVATCFTRARDLCGAIICSQLLSVVAFAYL